MAVRLKKRKAEDPCTADTEEEKRKRILTGKYYCDKCYREIPEDKAYRHNHPNCSWTTCVTCQRHQTKCLFQYHGTDVDPFECGKCGIEKAMQREKSCHGFTAFDTPEQLYKVVDMCDTLSNKKLSKKTFKKDVNNIKKALEEHIKTTSRKLYCLRTLFEGYMDEHIEKVQSDRNKKAEKEMIQWFNDQLKDFD